MSEYALQLKNICKSYKDGNEDNLVLDNISLNVKPGEFIAILGPSGSGKTTLLSIAGALLSPTSGEVIIGNSAVSSNNKKEWTKIRQKQIGFIFQTHQLVPFLNVEEQLSYMAEIKNNSKESKEIKALLEDLGLSKKLKSYPNELSGGEKQRVAIARAFINQPDIILADEPTASLDSVRGRQVMELFKQETQKYNKATIIVTHDERILDLVDEVYVMGDGRLTQK